MGDLASGLDSQPGTTLSRAKRLTARGRLILAHPAAPIGALCVILLLSLGARVVDIDEPCTSPCETSSPHTLIFDEHYYVNAARVIAGIDPPAGQPYHGAPLGDDPNAEHPQLAKIVMAGGISLFGDDPTGWRIGSVLFGLIALLALYSLVRAAGGSRWLAVGASAVMGLDNLLLLHGRIATLDIYAVAMMIVAADLYLRRRPILAGVAAGVAGCMKEVGLYVVIVIALFELLRIVRARFAEGTPSGWLSAGARPLMVFVLSSLVSAVGLLWLLDVLVPAYNPGSGKAYAGDPFAHIAHIWNYAQLLKTKPDETGISSTPWQWLLNEAPINYARVAVNTLSGGKVVGSRATINFRGEMNPFIIFLAIPALFAALAGAWREGDELGAIGACWCLGAFLPFVYESGVSGRITYLYYMVIVMPGIYLVVTRLFARTRIPRAATIGWALALVYGFVDLFPFRDLL